MDKMSLIFNLFVSVVSQLICVCPLQDSGGFACSAWLLVLCISLEYILVFYIVSVLPSHEISFVQHLPNSHREAVHFYLF